MKWQWSDTSFSRHGSVTSRQMFFSMQGHMCRIWWYLNRRGQARGQHARWHSFKSPFPPCVTRGVLSKFQNQLCKCRRLRKIFSRHFSQGFLLEVTLRSPRSSSFWSASIQFTLRNIRFHKYGATLRILTVLGKMKMRCLMMRGSRIK